MGIKKKIKNSLRAFIIGDALGVPFEFQEKGTITCNGFIGFGTYNKPAGTWSDDTTVVLCLLDALNRSNLDFDKAETLFKENLSSWYYENRFTVDGVFDIGNQTASSIESKFENQQTDRMGNGALFYLPLAFCSVKKDLQKEDFIRFCKITHNNMNCFEYGWNLCQIIQGILNNTPFQIELNSFENRGDVINTSNFVLDFFLQLKDSNWPLMNCLYKIIEEGEDTDTNAAILGLLLGLLKDVDEKDWGMIRRHELADQIITEFIQKTVY